MTKFKNKTLLVTGGTGTFGQAFVKYFIRNFKDIKKIIIFTSFLIQNRNLNTELVLQKKNNFQVPFNPNEITTTDFKKKNRLQNN